MNISRLLCAVAAGLVLIGSPCPVLSEKLEVLTSEWSPYVSREMPDDGFAAEVVIYAFLASGIETDVTFTSWARCEANVKSGVAVASFPHKQTAERAAYALFSEPIAMSRGVFFYLKETRGPLEFERLEDLAPYTIGGTHGVFYVSDFKKAGLTVDYASESAISFKKLYLGMVDLVPENEFVGWGLIQKFYPDELYRFAASSTPYSENTLHLMISNRHPDAKRLLREFNAGLKIIRDKGVYQKLLKKYVRNVTIQIPKSPY